MQDKFKTFIEEESLIATSDRVLLAVSGGVDSMVMVDLFYKNQIPFGICHCNFSLRGKESEEDAQFVGEVAQKYNIPFYIKKFDAKEESKNLKLSIQETARKLRYDWFFEILVQEKYNKLATAHHLNDSIETIFYNLSKGCGISGLRGIPLEREWIIRPILNASKQEIEDYASQNKLSFRLDSSNLTDKYNRNLIRQKVIPHLQSFNPSLENTFQKNIKRFKEVEYILEDYIKKFKKKYTKKEKNKFEIPLKPLAKNPSRNTILFYLIKKYGFNEDQVIQMLESQTAGKKTFSKTHALYCTNESLVVLPIAKTETGELLIQESDKHIKFGKDVFFMVRFIANPNLNLREKGATFLDLNKLKFPVKLRRWQPGDFFYPFGMNGQRKKVKDFFVDLKMPVFEKEQQWIIESEGTICGVLGKRVDIRFKVNGKTKNILKIKVIEG